MNQKTSALGFLARDDFLLEWNDYKSMSSQLKH